MSICFMVSTNPGVKFTLVTSHESGNMAFHDINQARLIGDTSNLAR